MNQQGISTDIRRVLLRGDVFRLAVAVLVGTTLFQLLYATIEWVFIPLARGILDARDSSGMFGPTSEQLYLTFNGFRVYWGETLSLGLTLAVALILVMFLKRRLSRVEAESELEGEKGIEFDEETRYRTCPECLSDIPSAAQRCAYCTASVTPLQPQE